MQSVKVGTETNQLLHGFVISELKHNNNYKFVFTGPILRFPMFEILFLFVLQIVHISHIGSCHSLWYGAFPHGHNSRQNVCLKADPHQQTKSQLSVAKSKDKFCRDNFCLVRCVRIDMVIKPSNCVVGWLPACLKNCSILNSQSVSLQHVDSQTGHHKGGHSNVLQNSVPYIKGSLPLGFIKSMNHQDSFCPLQKL